MRKRMGDRCTTGEEKECSRKGDNVQVTDSLSQCKFLGEIGMDGRYLRQ